MTTVDGTNTATDAYTGTELPAINVSTMQMSGPAGSAIDPVTNVDDPGLDATAATLSATASTITATITVPKLSTGTPADALSDQYYIDWDYKGQVYYATAAEDVTGAFTYSSGTTKTGFPENTASSAAKGAVDMTTGQIAITFPASEVGSPTQCSALTVPQAFTSLVEGAAGETAESFDVDELDTYRGYSVDGGQSDSIGEDVIVGGTAACGLPEGTFPALTTSSTGTTTSTTTTPVTSTTTPCQTTSKLPVTHITKKALSRSGFTLSGTAAAHCPDTITKVGLSIARAVVKKVKGRKRIECEFLTAKHRFTKAGSCAPRDYFTAKGLGKWSFSVKAKFTKGTYRIWEHATDNKKYTTKNVASKFVFVRFS